MPAMTGWRALLVVLLLAAAAVAQATNCQACFAKGTVPCTKHGRFLEQEKPENGTVFCSVAADCKNCLGALAVDCKQCRNEAAETDLQRRQQLVQDWLKQRRAAIEPLAQKGPPLYLKTAHCELAFAIKPLMVGKDKLDTHALMHLYGQRIEAERKLFCEVFEATDQDLPGTLQVYMFREFDDHTKVCPVVTGIGAGRAAAGIKLMGVDCIYCMWQEPRALPGDEALHRHIVHHMAHLLLSNLNPPQWLGNRGHGWVDEGVAHWFEDKLTDKCANFCFEEVLLQPGANFKAGRWRTPVRKMVDEGKCRSFAELAQLGSDQLTFPDHAQAFAYVDFLIATHGGKALGKLVGLLKEKKPIGEALQQVYQLNPLTIETAWQAWVKENYSPLER